MHANRIIYVIILIAGFSCRKSIDEYVPDISCQCTSITSTQDKYIYLVQPNSTAWNQAGAAGGLDSIYKLCQVPSNILSTMSTLGIIQSLETNPCLFNMFLRDNKFQGRDEVLGRLNINSELLKRVDAATQIIDYYNQKQPCCIEGLSDALSRGKYANQWYLFDMICTQDNLLSKMSDVEKVTFSRIVLNKFYVQTNYPSTFGSSKTSSVLILSQLMIAAKYAPYIEALNSSQTLLQFSQTGIPNINLDDVLSHAKRFSK